MRGIHAAPINLIEKSVAEDMSACFSISGFSDTKALIYRPSGFDTDSMLRIENGEVRRCLWHTSLQTGRCVTGAN